MPPALAVSDKARLAAVLDRPGVVAARLFGSRARGTSGASSDVDVAIWLDLQLEDESRFGLGLALEAAAAAALPAETVDLVTLNDATPLLTHRALADGVLLIDRDPRARVRLEAAAIIEYLDTQPLRDEMAQGLGNRLAEDRFGRR